MNSSYALWNQLQLTDSTYPCSGTGGATVLTWRLSNSTSTSSGGNSSSCRIGSLSTAFWCSRRNSSKSGGSTTSFNGICRNKYAMCVKRCTEIMIYFIVKSALKTLKLEHVWWHVIILGKWYCIGLFYKQSKKWWLC